MGRPGRRLDRLLAIAHGLGVTPNDPFPVTPDSSSMCDAMLTSEDEARLQEALNRTRSVRLEQKTNLFRKTASKSTFDAKEASAALEFLIQDGCSAEVAERLIQMGADVNFSRHKSNSVAKRVRKKDQEDVRSDLFRLAVQRGDLKLIAVLAKRADKQNCDTSLAIAIARDDPKTAKILMAAGANPNWYATAFENAIRVGNADLVCALSDSTIAPSVKLVSENLYEAVKSNQLSIVQALLWRGADADAQNPSALSWATQCQNAQIVAALCLAKSPPSPEHLSKALSFTYSGTQSLSTECVHVIEVLLAAGARGTEVADMIIEATNQEHHRLVKMLVEYSEFDEERSPIAIRSAMKHGDIVSFHALATISLQPTVVDDLLAFLPSSRPAVLLETRLSMLRSVIDGHPSKAAISRALIDASENLELESVRFLVERGASADYESGKACVFAVQTQATELLSILLTTRPSGNTLSRAFAALQKVSSATKIRMMEALLRAGAIGTEVDKALQLAMEDRKEPRENYNVIEVLVRGGADVNAEHGACLLSTITRADPNALKLLLTGFVKPEAKVLKAAFSAATRVENSQIRFEIMDVLLVAGARGRPVAIALIGVIDSSPSATNFAKLLLEKGSADINHDNGEAVCRAVRYQNRELLEMLIRYDPSQTTLNNALHEAVKLSHQPKRLGIIDILLQRDVRGTALDEVLAIVAAFHLPDQTLVEKLLQSGASADYNAGHAMRIALARSDDALLSLLLNSSPPVHPATLSYVLADAVKIGDGSRRLEMSRMLMNKRTLLPAEDLGAILLDTFDSSHDLRTLELFLEAGVHLDRYSFAAIEKAIGLSHDEALKLLMDASPAVEAVQRAFQCAWNAKASIELGLLEVVIKHESHRRFVHLDQYLVVAVQEIPCSQALVSFLLDAGASVDYKNSQCIREAVTKFKNETLGLLIRHARVDSAVVGFEAAIEYERTWYDPSGLEVLEMLLEGGAFGEAVDQALLLAVERYESHADAPSIVHLLITNTASPASSDYRSGLTFELAARKGNRPLVRKLLESQPSAITINNAFPYILTSPADEETTLRLIEDFSAFSQEKLHVGLNLDESHRELRPSLFLYFERWPKRTAILRALLSHGAHADQRIDATDFNFTTTTSGRRPLLAAVKHSQPSLVNILLSHCADPAVSDCFDRTPLNYASMQGNLMIMRLLIGANAPSDDGSLQEAVAKYQVDAVALLLDAGHDPNYPSNVHHMRGPLEHLIRQQPSSQQQPSTIKNLFKLLVQGGANGRYQCDGKSLLILALDMLKADVIVPPLLSAFMGKIINEDFDLHRNHGFVFSPTSYLIHGQQLSDPSLKPVLLRALRSYGCKDVYYCEDGPQPAGYTGAPPDVVDRERRRLRRLEQNAIEDEQRQRRINLELEDRQRRIALEKEDHQRSIRLRREDEDNRRLLAYETHITELTHEQERARARNSNNRNATALRLEQQAQENAQS